MTTAEFDVFLSHNSVDKPWVSQLKADLARYNVRAWLDKDEIRPGNVFAEDLELALENSRAVALVISPEALASGWVKEEYYRRSYWGSGFVYICSHLPRFGRNVYFFSTYSFGSVTNPERPDEKLGPNSHQFCFEILHYFYLVESTYLAPYFIPPASLDWHITLKAALRSIRCFACKTISGLSFEHSFQGPNMLS